MSTTPGIPAAATHRVSVRVTESCRLCGDSDLTPVLDLGEQHLANAFHESGVASPRAPLALLRCRTCSLVQLEHRVDPAALYTRYAFRSGLNRTVCEHLRGLVRRVVRLTDLRPGDSVLDIGCNDGTALDWFPDGTRTVGIDPSNIRPLRCSAFVRDYFSASAVRDQLGSTGAAVILSIGMFSDVDDPKGFVRDVERCLAAAGVWVVEATYLPSMIESTAFDCACHEHVGYYRLATFEQLLVDTELQVFDVEFNGRNGGSFRLYIGRPAHWRPTDRVDQVRHLEQYGGFDTPGPYLRFRRRAETSRAALLDFLAQAQRRSQPVWGYGASTNGQVLLQYCGIRPDQVVAIADRSPDKIGCLTPGTDLRITGEAEMRSAAPEFLLVLPWYLLGEFLARERPLLEAGTRMVVPLPELRVLGPSGHTCAMPW